MKFWGVCSLVHWERGEWRSNHFSDDSDENKCAALEIQGDLSFSLNLLVSSPDLLNPSHRSLLTQS